MIRLTRITQTPGTLEIWTGGRCYLATPATPIDGPTFEMDLEDAAAEALMADPGLATHFAAKPLSTPKTGRVAGDKPVQA